MRHGFVIVFFFVFDSNFRPEDGDQDAPLYNGYLFQRGREQERNPQPQPQPAYPPYPYYLTGNPRIPLQYVPEPAPRSCSPMPGCSEPSAGISQAETCGEKGEKSRRTSWEPAEVRSLIAAYRDNYDRLRSTKSSRGQKNVCDSIKEDFLSSCSDAGIETEKTLAQVKEKWRSLFDKYKAVKDNNNKTGRDRRTFGFYDEIDEFMSGSDKVNPKFVKETRVMQVRTKDSPTSSDSGNSDASATVTIADPTTAAVGEKPNEKDDSPCRPKKKKKRASLEGKEAESTILNLLEAQQAAIEKADEKDERMFEALLKSQSDSQQRHQEFTLSVLGKLGEIFSSKK